MGSLLAVKSGKTLIIQTVARRTYFAILPWDILDTWSN